MAATQTWIEPDRPELADPLGLTAYVKERAVHHLRDGGTAAQLLTEAMKYLYPQTSIDGVAKNLQRLASWIQIYGKPDFSKVLRWADQMDRKKAADSPQATAAQAPAEFETCTSEDKPEDGAQDRDSLTLRYSGSQIVEPFGVVGLLVVENTLTGRAVTHQYTDDTRDRVLDLARRTTAELGHEKYTRMATYEFSHVPTPAEPDGKADYPNMRA